MVFYNNFGKLNGMKNFFRKNQTVNILGFNLKFSVATTQLCHYYVKEYIESTQTNFGYDALK